jgi:hypothetical protein
MALSDLEPGGPYSPERTTEVARMAAEAIHYLNLATRDLSGDALREPAAVDRVLAELDSLAERLPQLLGQLGAWLAAECRAGRLRVAYGTWAHSSTEAQVAVLAVSAIGQYLTEAAGHAGRTRQALHDARQITAAIAAAPGDDDEEEDR